MSTHIAWRLDASASIGSGHLMRGLTLANALAAEGVLCSFLLRPTALASLVSAAGHRLMLLPEHGLDEEGDAAECRRLLAEAGMQLAWLIVDHYQLGASWERAMRADGQQIMAVDDLANRPHAVQMLLDGNAVANQEQRYDGLLPADCRRLLGSRHALLRPEFAASATPPVRSGLKRILVSFGGSDPANATALALKALTLAGWGEQPADVVIGALHPDADGIRAVCAQHPSWRLHVQTPHLHALMQAADLCIGASGVSSWERCALGLPSIVLTLADNQVALARELAERGAALWPGDAGKLTAEALSSLIRSLQQCPQLLIVMSRAAARLCDGRGATRVVTALLGSALTLRPATAADAALTLDWRNHAEARRHSGNEAVINAQEHAHWLGHVLADADRQLLIASLNGQPLGVLRFDALESGKPEISIYLNPARMGAGWGSALLRVGTAWLHTHGVTGTVHARISPHNYASLRSFADAGYRQQTSTWQLPLAAASCDSATS